MLNLEVEYFSGRNTLYFIENVQILGKTELRMRIVGKESVLFSEYKFYSETVETEESILLQKSVCTYHAFHLCISIRFILLENPIPRMY